MFQTVDWHAAQMPTAPAVRLEWGFAISELITLGIDSSSRLSRTTVAGPVQGSSVLPTCPLQNLDEFFNLGALLRAIAALNGVCDAMRYMRFQKF